MQGNRLTTLMVFQSRYGQVVKELGGGGNKKKALAHQSLYIVRNKTLQIVKLSYIV